MFSTGQLEPGKPELALSRLQAGQRALHQGKLVGERGLGLGQQVRQPLLQHLGRCGAAKLVIQWRPQAVWVKCRARRLRSTQQGQVLRASALALERRSSQAERLFLPAIALIRSQKARFKAFMTWMSLKSCLQHGQGLAMAVRAFQRLNLVQRIADRIGQLLAPSHCQGGLVFAGVTARGVGTSATTAGHRAGLEQQLHVIKLGALHLRTNAGECGVLLGVQVLDGQTLGTQQHGRGEPALQSGQADTERCQARAPRKVGAGAQRPLSGPGRSALAVQFTRWANSPRA